MSYQTILSEQRGRVGLITLNRPERLNAYNGQMMADLRDQIERWNEDAGIGAIVVTGAGRSFCAGADMGGFQQEITRRETGEAANRQQWGPAVRDNESWTEFAMRSKPLIAAINGHAIGVGLTLILPFDVRIASDRARLSMRFVRVGIIPELGSTHLLSHITGVTHALELMLSGRMVDAAEAGRIGLVSRVVNHEDLLDQAMATADEIAFNPTQSLLDIKKVTWANLIEPSIPEVMRKEGEVYAAAQSRPAWKEAVTAFMEKREPNFHQG